MLTAEDIVPGAVQALHRGSAARVLRAFAAAMQEEAAAAALSKRRDTERGRRIIDDYEASHAGPDAVVDALRMRAAAAEASAHAWAT